MSLINEALKKAQRQRTDDPGATASMGGAGANRGKPSKGNFMVVIACGAIALVVVSVVVTFYFANRPAAPKQTPITGTPSVPPTTSSAAASSARSPVIAPTISAPVPEKVSPPPAPANASLPNATAAVLAAAAKLDPASAASASSVPAPSPAITSTPNTSSIT